MNIFNISHPCLVYRRGIGAPIAMASAMQAQKELRRTNSKLGPGAEWPEGWMMAGGWAPESSWAGGSTTVDQVTGLQNGMNLKIMDCMDCMDFRTLRFFLSELRESVI